MECFKDWIWSLINGAAPIGLWLLTASIVAAVVHDRVLRCMPESNTSIFGLFFMVLGGITVLAGIPFILGSVMEILAERHSSGAGLGCVVGAVFLIVGGYLFLSAKRHESLDTISER